MADAVITTGPDFVVTSWNAAAERIYGIPSAEALGRAVPTLFETRWASATDREASMLALRTRGVWEGDVVQACLDGRLVRVHSKVTVVRDDAGEIRAVIAVNRDFTERWETERALAQAREHLLLSQKMEALGRLAGGVAHDFNNLLMGILGSVELSRELVEDDSRVQGLLDQALRAGRRASALTTQLMAFSSHDVTERETFELGALLRSMDELLAGAAGESNHLALQIAETGLWVRGSRGQLEQALVHLVVNSRDALSPGGRVTVRLERAGQWAVLTVEDDGAGMDEQTRSRAFEPFFSTKGRGRSSGLGLSMVFAACREFGGEVTLHSEPGRGTVVRLELPLSDAPPDRAARPREAGPAAAVGLRVLLAEDQAPVREVLAAMLHRLGHEVVAAADGIDALEHFDDDVDLLLTDVVMPRLGGPGLARALRERAPSLPVVFLSGYADSELDTDDWPAGERLRKPTTLAALGEAIARAWSARTVVQPGEATAPTRK